MTYARLQTGPESATILYEVVAERLLGLVSDGVFRCGDRLPSIRRLARDWHVSLNTVTTAYALLESRGRIVVRSQSGHYVASEPTAVRSQQPSASGRFRLVSTPVKLGSRRQAIQSDLTRRDVLPLGGGGPNPDLLPKERLHRITARQLRRFPHDGISYAPANGFESLRTAIARRAIGYAQALSPDDIIITAGCTEAVTLALRATCRPGDTIAIGSPVYYSFLNLIESLSLRVLEVPPGHGDGLDLDFLAAAAERQMISACLAIPNFNNPLGNAMSSESKRRLVELLSRWGIPLIEDDVYGDLGFAAERPSWCQRYDRDGLVLSCSSFSKTLAPGYRIGWIAAARYRARVAALKSLSSVAAASPMQLAVAEFLENGGYDHHLRSLRRAYQRQTASMRSAVLQSFPAGTVVSPPAGGSVLWVRLPGSADATSLHEQALRAGIAIAPGRLFSLGRRFGDCFRLNAAHWSPAVEDAIGRLGTMVHALPVADSERGLA